MDFKTNPEIEIDARALSDLLDTAKPGDVVTYDALSQLIGRNVRGAAWSALTKARREQLKKQRLFECVRDVGLKLETDATIAEGVPEYARKRIRSVAKRCGAKLAAIADFDKLSNDQKTRVLTAQSIVGAVAAFTSAAGARRVEKLIGEATNAKALPLAATLEAFKE